MQNEKSKCKIFKKLKKRLPKIQENISLANHTTFKIGGLARYFFVAENKEDLIKAVKTAKELDLPFFILARGSNVLFSDKGFKGLIIKCQMSNVKCSKEKIYAEAGVRLNELARITQENSLTGLEWMAGIPGRVGGAVYNNAQAFERKISDNIESVEVLDIDTLNVKNFSKEECQFSVKNSIFKKNPSPPIPLKRNGVMVSKKLIILSVVLKLDKEDKKKIEDKVRYGLSFRRERHPLDMPSAGSFFINPVDPEDKEKIIPAGYLIEKCGLKGKRIGNAQISEKHANFIVNLGGAKAEDVLDLMKLAKQKVKEKFNIELKEEVQIIN